MNTNEFKPLKEWDLQEGMLFEDERDRVFQYKEKYLPNEHFIFIFQGGYIELSSNGLLKFRPTTAHDAGINPEDLPMEEPFWTGWALLDGKKKKVKDWDYYSTSGNQTHAKNSVFVIFENGEKWSGSQYPDHVCHPCLPPPITNLNPETCELLEGDITDKGVVKDTEPSTNNYLVEIGGGYETIYMRDELRLLSRDGRPVIHKK